MDEQRRFTAGVFSPRYEWGELVEGFPVGSRIGEELWGEPGGGRLIERCVHSCREFNGGKRTAVEVLAANDVQGSVRRRGRADREQAEGRAVRQIFELEEGSFAVECREIFDRGF